MAKSKSKSKSKDPLYDIIAGALIKANGRVCMKELAAACKLVKAGESVPSSVSAKIRLRVNKMVEGELVKKTGAKSTTKYKALAKLKKQYAA